MQENIIQIVFLAIATALLEMYYQFIQTEKQIFEPWKKFWFKYVRYKAILSKYGRNIPLVSFMAYIAKPIALCPYCNGTWLSIIVYIIVYGFSLPLFLFIAITWLFIRLIDKYHLL